MRIRVLPYKIGSASARLLSRALGGLCVRSDGRYIPRATDFIINWGSGTFPTWWPHTDRGFDSPRVLNMPGNVANAANKLRTFEILQRAGVSIPEYTTNRDTARIWQGDGTVYARETLTGHSGSGIVVIDQSSWYTHPAPLYVKGIQNHGEYRVHVVAGRVIDYIKKRRHNDDRPNQAQSDVRNLANGWVYSRQNLRRLERVEQLAVRAVSALGLDFGAVDIIMDEEGDVFVLEVNTACGMSDTTLNAYSEAFTNLTLEHAN